MIDQPEEDFDFDEFFELWQAGVEDAHVRQVLATLEAQGRGMLAREATNRAAGAANAGPPRHGCMECKAQQPYTVEEFPTGNTGWRCTVCGKIARLIPGNYSARYGLEPGAGPA